MARGRFPAGGCEPMLAKTLTPANLTLPCYVQPKLDGYRCLWDGRTAWTRGGKPHADHVQRLLAGKAVPAGGWLDGELIADGLADFGHVQSAVTGGDGADAVRFVAFDCITPGRMPFAERIGMVPNAIETRYVTTSGQLDAAMDRFIAAGYEGLIARDPNAPYRHGRTGALLKAKRFCDAEFPILGVEEAAGKDAGTAVIVCATASGRTFRVRPMGDRASRAKLWDRRNRLIGRMYTVRYQELTRAGVPRFGVGVGLR